MQHQQSDSRSRSGACADLERRLVAEASSAFREPSPGFSARALAAIDSDIPEPPAARRITPLTLGWASLVAAALALVGVVRFAGLQTEPTARPSATAAISSALDAVPRPSQTLARLVSAPVRAETEALAEQTRRVADAIPLRLAVRSHDH